MDKNDIKECKTLEELFSLWENEHELEDEESCDKTICDAIINNEGNKLYIPKNSFIADGYINEYKIFNGVLFILKEANVRKSDILTKIKHGVTKNNLDPQYPFYRKYISYNIGLNKPKQQEKMGRMAYYIIHKKTPQEKDDFKEALAKSAFINLNKRGGSNQSKKIKNYVDKYQDFIRKQIDIIKPKIIICVGTYDYLYKMGVTKDYTCFNIWHTAYQMPNRERKRIYNLNDANVDLYMEEFIRRVKL